MIDGARAIGQAGMDIFAGEIGEVGQQFLDRHGGCEGVQHIADAHPCAGDDGASAADIRVDDDARGHGWIMWGRWAGVKSAYQALLTPRWGIWRTIAVVLFIVVSIS